MAEKLSCNSCNFKWNSKTGKVPTRCPYCGKDGSVMDMDSSEARFLDVDDLLK